jgi:hypothetical protein
MTSALQKAEVQEQPASDMSRDLHDEEGQHAQHGREPMQLETEQRNGLQSSRIAVCG